MPIWSVHLVILHERETSVAEVDPRCQILINLWRRRIKPPQHKGLDSVRACVCVAHKDVVGVDVQVRDQRIQGVQVRHSMAHTSKELHSQLQVHIQF